MGPIAVLPIAVALAAAPAARATPTAIDVRGTATCPTPALVAASLSFVPRNGHEAADALEVDDVSPPTGPTPQIEVRLVHVPSGAALASRRLDKYGSCEETAQALALLQITATWAARYNPVPSAALPLPEPKAPAAPPVLVRARPRASPPLVSVGAGAGLIAAGGASAAPFAAVEVEARPADRPLGDPPGGCRHR